MDFLLPPRRVLGPLTLCSGALTVLAFATLSWTAAPLAVLFVISAFVWTMSRTFGPVAAAPATGAGCAGCPAGCVGCRERIDAGG